MQLMKVNRVYERTNFLEIVGSNFRLAVTSYHAFLNEDKNFVTAETITPGSKIWIDISAFKSDGSLTFKK